MLYFATMQAYRGFGAKLQTLYIVDMKVDEPDDVQTGVIAHCKV